MRQYRLAVVVGLALLGLVACSNDTPVAPTPSNQTTTVNVNVNTGGGGPGASPSPGQTCGAVATTRVGFFGIRCGSGATPPRNGEGRLPMGCLGDVTATPKNAQGDPVDPIVHGQNIVWRANFNRVRLVDEENAFNKTAVPESVGSETISATVTPPGCGPVPGEFSFQVTAASSSSGDVVAMRAPQDGDLVDYYRNVSRTEGHYEWRYMGQMRQGDPVPEVWKLDGGPPPAYPDGLPGPSSTPPPHQPQGGK